jgi:nucleoside-diphosphate-sugar epimerase
VTSSDRITAARPRSLLVTGASGFIGSHLVRAALASGYRVRALLRDRRQTQALGPVEPFEGDLLEPGSLAGIADTIDYVVHCAGVLGKWGRPESLLYDVNVQGSLNLLRACRGAGWRRFLHLSAGGVTGPLQVRQVDESHPCRPATAYENSKLLGEQTVLEQAQAWNLPASVLRPTFTYGPGDPHKLPLFRAIQRGRFVFIGSAESVLHPVYIDDLIGGILLALERARDGETYILGGERPVTKSELVFAIADALGARRPWIHLPLWIAGPAAGALEWLGQHLHFEPILTRSRVSMMSENFGYTIDRARKQLGYAPQTSLADGIRQTVDAYRRAGLL